MRLYRLRPPSHDSAPWNPLIEANPIERECPRCHAPPWTLCCDEEGRPMQVDYHDERRER